MIDLCSENKSTIFTINSNFKDGAKTFQEPKLANAILDWTLYHTTVVNIEGDFHLFKEAYKKRKINQGEDGGPIHLPRRWTFLFSQKCTFLFRHLYKLTKLSQNYNKNFTFIGELPGIKTDNIR